MEKGKMVDTESSRYTETTQNGIKTLEPKIEKVAEPAESCSDLYEWEKQNKESEKKLGDKMSGPSAPNILDKK